MTKEKKTLIPPSLEHLESWHNILRQVIIKHGGEPIPDFKYADKEKLSSALYVVDSSFGGRERYSTIEEKSAAYLYYLNKSHALQNGNKRFSVTCFMGYVALNNKTILPLAGVGLADIAAFIAESDPAKKDKVIKELVELIKEENIIISE